MQAIGYDMDYTLAQYKPDTFEQLAHTQTVDKLVTAFGYPPELYDFKFDWRYMMRGLIIDKVGSLDKSEMHLGWIVDSLSRIVVRTGGAAPARVLMGACKSAAASGCEGGAFGHVAEPCGAVIMQVSAVSKGTFVYIFAVAY